MVNEALETLEVSHSQELAPRLLGEPLGRARGHFTAQLDASSEEEPELVVVQSAVHLV